MFLIGDREFSNAIDVDLADIYKLFIQLEYTFLSNAPGTCQMPLEHSPRLTKIKS